MAQSDRQGTGRHPHGSTEEPRPHTRDDQGAGEHRSHSTHTSQGGASDRPTHSSHSSRDDQSQRSSGGARQGEASRSEHHGSGDADLKQREYRDEKGEVHHHTRTYMEQHKGEENKK